LAVLLASWLESGGHSVAVEQSVTASVDRYSSSTQPIQQAAQIATTTARMEYEEGMTQGEGDVERERIIQAARLKLKDEALQAISTRNTTVIGRPYTSPFIRPRVSLNFHCSICDTPCHTSDAFKQHCAGKKHKEREQVYKRGLRGGVDWSMDPTFAEGCEHTHLHCHCSHQRLVLLRCVCAASALLSNDGLT